MKSSAERTIITSVLYGQQPLFSSKTIHRVRDFGLLCVTRLFYALRTMQNGYKEDHGSYATTFSQLGLPLGAKLDGDVLIWDGGYRYRIMDTASDATGTVARYCIDARPMTYSYRSRRSFRMDQTGRIHFTSADRGATVADPLLDSSR